MPGRHPDDDVLADLAADVLPLDEARAVEAHVLGCDRCASLLSDAERVRALLLADDAGPVPPEIWNRIEAALQDAAAASTTRTEHGPRSTPSPPPPPDAPATRRVDAAGRGGWDGPDPLDDPDAWATAARPAVASDSPARPGAGSGIRRPSASRRDVRPDRRPRSTTLLLGAAAAVVLVMAVGAVRLLQSGGGPSAAFDSSGSAAGASASAAAGAAAVAGTVITRSGKDYTSATLADAARSLVRQPAANQAESTAGGEGTRSFSGAAPRASAAPSVAPDPTATDVTNPQRLAACLTALGAASDSVVAVDLARYQGREAAVLVVRTETGYEVWVVERTCHPGDEGALAERTLAG